MTEYVPAQHKVAGHDSCFVSSENESIFVKLTTPQEIQFYVDTIARQKNDGIQEGTDLADWLPGYLGVLTRGDIRHEFQNQFPKPLELKNDALTSRDGSFTDNVPHDSRQYIVLQNLYHGFRSPSILDIKLGSVLTDDQASSEKKLRLQNISRTTTSGSMHMRICGMKVFNKDLTSMPEEIYPGMKKHINLTTNPHEMYLEFGKMFGRSLTDTNAMEGIRLFFQSVFQEKEIYKRLLKRFIERLQLLYNCLLDQEIRVFSGSLLFMYEGDLSEWEEALQDDETYDLLDPILREMNIDESEYDDESDGDRQNTVTNFIGGKAPDNEGITESSSKNLFRGPDISLRKAPLSGLNLIDLAHARYTKGQGYDENIIMGIENLIRIFEDLLEDIQ